MKNKFGTLAEFELNRSNEKFIPPNGSNYFFNIGDGKINLKTNIENDLVSFDLFTDDGEIYTGPGTFYILGTPVRNSQVYRSLTVIEGTTLYVNNVLRLYQGKMDVYGTLILNENSSLVIDGLYGSLIFHPGSKLIINNGSKISVERENTSYVYGDIECHINSIDSLSGNIILDPSSTTHFFGIDFPDRLFSLTDYDTELNHTVINSYTQGEKNIENGRIGYVWSNGDIDKSFQEVDLKILHGEVILGDFRLPIYGSSKSPLENKTSFRNFHIKENTTLYITESYKEMTYVRPELYIGIVVGNNKSPGICTVDGSIIVDGNNSMVTIDRKGKMFINDNAEVYLRNGSIMRCTNCDDEISLIINGTLIIDDIEQISTFKKENIKFGENGKVIILNPDKGEKRLLFSTPNGIEKSDLYRIFKDNIDHIEYHISNNTGIEIDQYYEFYYREMTKWYGNRRIEKAIYDKIIIWHDGGFIQLNHDIIPWVNKDCTLLEASRVFKTFGSYDSDRLQDAVNRLIYVGCGNILFRFIDGEEVKEVLLNLEDIKMNNIINIPGSDVYELKTSNTGDLYLRNNIYNTNIDTLVNEQSKQIPIEKLITRFELK